MTSWERWWHQKGEDIIGGGILKLITALFSVVGRFRNMHSPCSVYGWNRKATARNLCSCFFRFHTKPQIHKWIEILYLSRFFVLQTTVYRILENGLRSAIQRRIRKVMTSWERWWHQKGEDIIGGGILKLITALFSVVSRFRNICTLLVVYMGATERRPPEIYVCVSLSSPLNPKFISG